MPTTSSCTSLLHFPQTDCGSGTCLNSTCLCPPGWSSLGDQAFIPGAACNINIFAVQLLWGLVLATLLPSFYFAILGLTNRIHVKSPSEPLHANIARLPRLWAVPMGLFVYCVGMSIVAFGKIINPTQWWIGLDPTATVLVFLAVAASGVSGFSGMHGMIDIAVQQTALAMHRDDPRELITRRQRANVIHNICMTCYILADIASIGVLWSPDHVLVFTCIFGGFKFLGLVMYPRFVIDPVVNILVTGVEARLANLEVDTRDGAANIKALKAALKKLKDVKKLADGLPMQGVLVAIPCMWPFLVGLLSYVYPVSLMGTGPSAAFVLSVTQGVGGGKKKALSAVDARGRIIPAGRHFTVVDDGQAVAGATISIVQHDTLDVNLSDALIVTHCVTPLALLLQNPMSRYMLGLVISFTLTIILIVALCVVPVVSIVFFVLVIVTTSIAACTILSKPVMTRLLKSDFLRLRMITVIVGLGTLADTLFIDLRVLIPPALCALQLFAFCTDALLVPQLRSVFVLGALLCTTTTFIVIFFNLAPALSNTVLPIGQGYSILQSARDGLLAQMTLFVVEAAFVIRGRNEKRFLHVTNPVERVLMDRAETHARERPVHDDGGGMRRHHGNVGNASSVIVQSGFMLRQVSEFPSEGKNNNDNDNDDNEETSGDTSSPKRRARVYVNKVAVKQLSGYAYIWYGPNLGEHLVSMLESRTGLVLLALCLLLPFIAALIMPLCTPTIVQILSYATVPCLFYVVIRQTALLSANIVRLLTQRVSFVPRIVLVLAWMAVASAILGDTRAIVVVFAAMAHVLLNIVGDATTSKTSQSSGIRALTTVGSSPTILVLSIYFLLDSFPNVADVSWSLSGGLNVNNTNSPDVIDAGQLCGDFGLFSLAIPTLVLFVRAMWNSTMAKGDHHNKQYFEVFAAPVAPRYESGIPFAISTSIGGGSPSPNISKDGVVGGGGDNNPDNDMDAASRMKELVDAAVMLSGGKGDEPEIIMS